MQLMLLIVIASVAHGAALQMRCKTGAVFVLPCNPWTPICNGLSGNRRGCERGFRGQFWP
jgi:hypothetical protein